MSTYTEFTYQVVFGCKYRRDFLVEAHQDKLFEFMSNKLSSLSCLPIIQGGHRDHLHLLFGAPPHLPVSKITQELKKSSHRFIDNHKEYFPKFKEWQVGFGGFTYRKSDRPGLIRYIRNQKSHHQKESFKEEFIRLIIEHNIPFEEKYLFI